MVRESSSAATDRVLREAAASSRSAGWQASGTVILRMAEQPMLMARGSAAMWHGAVATRTASAVVRPPRPQGPMKVAFTDESSSYSSARRRS